MKPTHIVIHHSATERDFTAEQIRTAHLDRGWDDIGYHFVIDGEGKVFPGRAEDVQGAHALGINEYSLGVCLIGNFEEYQPTEAQMGSLKDLVKDLRIRFGIGAENVIGHCDVEVPGKKKRTKCPGKNLYCLLAEIR